MNLLLPIRTDRLVLRLMQPSDTPHFAAYRADPVLARYQGWSPMTEDEARRFVAAAAMPPSFGDGDWHQIAIADASSDALLGDIGLCVRGHGAIELGFTLAHEAQGRGVATEALGTLVQALFAGPKIERIVAETDERNHPCIRVLERLGMTLTARREAVFKQEACVELRYELERAP